jgi:hypothetical protein
MIGKIVRYLLQFIQKLEQTHAPAAFWLVSHTHLFVGLLHILQPLQVKSRMQRCFGTTALDIHYTEAGCHDSIDAAIKYQGNQQKIR